MSLDAIKKSILSEAEGNASTIDKLSTEEAKRIVKEAEDRARSIIKEAEADAGREVERLRKESEAGAETEANSLILEAKGEAVERAMKKVTSQLESELSRNGMKKIMDRGLRQFREIAEGDISIKTAKRNTPLLKDSKYRVEFGDIDGFMFYADEGKLALNATIDSIVERESGSARRLLSNALFEGRAPRRRPSNASKPKSKKAAKAKGKKR